MLGPGDPAATNNARANAIRAVMFMVRILQEGKEIRARPSVEDGFAAVNPPRSRLAMLTMLAKPAIAPRTAGVRCRACRLISSVKLYAQRNVGDGSGVFERVSADLIQRCRHRD
jgi:hypothetical protein